MSISRRNLRLLSQLIFTGCLTMITRRVILLLLLCAPLLAMRINAGAKGITPGVVDMRGKIVDAACYVDPDDQSILVEFNDISAREISTRGDKFSAHNFTIHLLGCSLGDSTHPGKIFHRASITFAGTSADGDKIFLSVQDKNNQEEGLAIEIFDLHGNRIELGKSSPDYELNPGTNTFRFTAWLVSLGKNVRSGDFNAVVHFVVNYL